MVTLNAQNQIFPEMTSVNHKKNKWAFPLVITTLISVFLMTTVYFNLGLVSSLHSVFSIFPSSNGPAPAYNGTRVYYTPSALNEIPRFAYLIGGAKGQLDMMWRVLQAFYHPLNQYILHLDLEAPAEERDELISRVEKHPLFSKVGNVKVMTKSDMITYDGPTMVSNTLHACAILLRDNKEWDWFINLSAADYPLVTQDDLIYVFRKLERYLNFIEHTSKLGWKLKYRALPLIVDPGLYSSQKSKIFRVKPEREAPTSIKLFTGSAWFTISRGFVDYLVWGVDNLPRTMLMYHSNFITATESYFQTTICNAPEFINTVVNNDLRYITWDNPPKQHPRLLSVNDFNSMINSNASIARKISRDDPVLDKIDKELLGREKDNFTPGGWCAGEPACSEVRDATDLKPGPGAQRLRSLIDSLINGAKITESWCQA